MSSRVSTVVLTGVVPRVEGNRDPVTTTVSERGTAVSCANPGSVMIRPNSAEKIR